MALPDTRLHPIYLVIETAKTLRSAIPFLVVTILGGAPWWVNAILFALIMVIAVAQWHVKKYSVISGVLRLRTGSGQPVGAGGADHPDHRSAPPTGR